MEEEEEVVQGKCLLPLGLSNFSETRNLFHSPRLHGPRNREEEEEEEEKEEEEEGKGG